MIRTADLTGAQLDYHTARAQGFPAERLEIRRVPRTDVLICCLLDMTDMLRRVPYSADWYMAGALLEQHKITLECRIDPVRWLADIGQPHWIENTGPTPQVAICRAVVRAAFGDEVEEVAVCE